MEQTPFEEQVRICKQFDSFCKTVLRNEANEYRREQKRLLNHEVCFSDLNQEQLEQLKIVDEWMESAEIFHIFEYEIEVRDELLYEDLNSLSETKRNVILLSFFMDLKDTEIAKRLNLVPSTIFHHRTSSLQKLKKLIEELFNEQNLSGNYNCICRSVVSAPKDDVVQSCSFSAILSTALCDALTKTSVVNYQEM